MCAAPSHPPERHWRPLVELALSEDIGSGDVTSSLVIGAQQNGRAVVEAREPLVVCGTEVARNVFTSVDSEADVRILEPDGTAVRAGAALAEVSGSLRGILAAERTALNFLYRMSGVATFTRSFVEAVAGTGARIVDTRKTLPGWRHLDKYAAAVGGAVNHRVGLYDGILLKDNHVAAAGGVAAAVKAALSAAPANLRVQVEVESVSEGAAALEAGADFLLLDNMSPEAMREAVATLGERAVLEATGGVTLASVRSVAETGVHRISIGALTHSAPGVDIALELAPEEAPAGGVVP